MHSYAELAQRNTEFILGQLAEVTKAATEALQSSGATSHVKALQAAQLARVIYAVGVFSIFEARLQDALASKNGFSEAKDILAKAEKKDLLARFEDLYCAINALKHGEGSSYKALCAKAEQLPFKVKLPEESFFNEGDVAEVLTLIAVDDKFVRYCSETIAEVSEVIRKERPNFVG